MLDRFLDWIVVALPLAMGIMGTLVGIRLARGAKDESHKRWWWAIVALGVVCGALVFWQQERTRKAHEQELGSQRNDIKGLEDRFNGRLDQLEAKLAQPEQKRAVQQVRKDMQYDPIVLHRMSNAELKAAENALSKEMIGFENDRDKHFQSTIQNSRLQLARAKDEETRNQINQEISRQSYTDYVDTQSQFRQNYLHRADAVRDELLFRLRKTPEQAEKDVLATLDPMTRMLHDPLALSRALSGTMNGPHAISDAAQYLDSLARLLN